MAKVMVRKNKGVVGKDIATYLADIKARPDAVSVGDQIRIPFKNGKSVLFVVTDIDKDGIRYESRNCLGKYVKMTDMDNYLNDILAQLPDALVQAIIPTERRHIMHNGTVRTDKALLFLPAASEIFPTSRCYGDSDLYKQLDWYKDVHNRVRAFSDDANMDTDWYWTSSPTSGSTASWCYVNGSGFANYYGASADWIGAPVCFRIPKS